MGTWSLPFTSKKRAEEFANKMSKPWLAEVSVTQVPHLKTITKRRASGSVVKTKKVVPGKTKTEIVFDINDLARLAGSDALFDAIASAAKKKKKTFDTRPLIKKFLRPAVLNTLKRPGKLKAQYSWIQIVQKSLGLKPTEQQKHKYQEILRKK
ncbi:MAG: hypothetical protein R3B41_00795 [Candidatus Doudnabacteria bacterium]